jgi:hypothetical protein
VWWLLRVPFCCVYLYEVCLCVGLCCLIRDVGMYHFLEMGIGCIIGRCFV